MSYEEETEYIPAYYRCVDPIENLRIRVVIQPVKNLFIPLPQFSLDETASSISTYKEESQSDKEEYTFKWQEKVLSNYELTKYTNNPDWRKKAHEKYHEGLIESVKNLKNHPKKLFTYVDVDNYSIKENEMTELIESSDYVSSLGEKMSELKMSGQNIRQFKSIPKRKVINYYPSEDFKSQSHLINTNVQTMFIMIDLGSKTSSEQSEVKEYVLCALSYNPLTNVLKISPSFSRSKSHPYIISLDKEDSRNSLHYWLHHASMDITIENLTKELNIMSKVIDHQEELRKLQIGTEFISGKPNAFHVILLGEITCGRDFEYDYLHIQYLIKPPSNWKCENEDSLMGATQTCRRNSFGICHFSYLFETNIYIEIQSIEDFLSSTPEIFFEVLSIDQYNRYRNEGYGYLTVPQTPGMYTYKLKCWRASDKSIRSKLQRFFIGGGPELEDVSYVGLHTSEKGNIISRFGFETIPSGELEVKLSIIHQSEFLKSTKSNENDAGTYISQRIDAGTLLGSVQTVLEAFRKARERMLQAKKGLDCDCNDSFLKLEEEIAMENGRSTKTKSD